MDADSFEVVSTLLLRHKIHFCGKQGNLFFDVFSYFSNGIIVFIYYSVAAPCSGSGDLEWLEPGSGSRSSLDPDPDSGPYRNYLNPWENSNFNNYKSISKNTFSVL